jgi:hypothetical protein
VPISGWLEVASTKPGLRKADAGPYRKALGGGRESVTAAIFWLKTRARWKETSVHEHAAHDETPITFKVTYGDSRIL